MKSRRNQTGDVRHVNHEHSTAGVRDLTEFLKVDRARVGTGTGNDHLRLALKGNLHHLVDLTNFDQTGKAVEKLLDSVNITCNKNTIPNDPKSPFVTSGVRLGTPAVTSRGLNTGDMDQIAEAIAMMIKEGEPAADRARAIVAELTAKYPLK